MCHPPRENRNSFKSQPGNGALHHTSLISTIVMGLVLAFVLGAAANRLRISPLVGYLLAGVVAGPFTPGFVADQALAPQLAEIGVILLMFGVGLHFSPKDLLSVKAIAIPGAIGQISVATLMGIALGWTMGWPLASGLVFGLALSVASTVIMLRELEQRRMIETSRGRIAVGWLVVEDLVMVLALVLLPALAEFAKPPAEGAASFDAMDLVWALLLTLGKVAAFIALMLVAGRRVIPWVLHSIAHTGSRELFRLAVLAISLGIAFAAAEMFGVSFALGAFFAGMILSESQLSQRAAEETLPLRDAFAVLFFVSVGMLFDPYILLREPWLVLATVLIIVLGKSIAAYYIVRAFGHPKGTALTISASLAQIGEFSFIVAALAVDLDLLTPEGRDLILAGAILSIFTNPLLFTLAERFEKQAAKNQPAPQAPDEAPPLAITETTGHIVLVGYGRVGSYVADGLLAAHQKFLIIEERVELVEQARKQGLEVIVGNAARAEVLDAANIAGAHHLLIGIPHAFEGSQIIRQARAVNPGLAIVARAHFDAEVTLLREAGASVIIMGEHEIARGMIENVMTNPATAPAA